MLAPKARFFADHFVAPFKTGWAAGWYVQRLYRSSKVSAAVCFDRDGTGGPPIEAVDARRFRVVTEIAQPGHGRRAFDWDRAVLIHIDRDGGLSIVTHLGVTLPGGERTEIVPTQTSALPVRRMDLK
jgi:hypothetical protein